MGLPPMLLIINDLQKRFYICWAPQLSRFFAYIYNIISMLRTMFSLFSTVTNFIIYTLQTKYDTYWIIIMNLKNNI